MNKNILLLSDFSKNSWKAIEYATVILEKFPCNFFVLNTYNIEHFGLSGNYTLDPDRSFNSLAERSSLQGLGHILMKATFELKNPNHQFHVISRPGPLLQTVDALVGELDIELIVMGAKGIGNKTEGKYGRNAHKLMHHISNCAVLVIPEECIPITGRDILTYADNHAAGNSGQLKILIDIASVQNANIHICNPRLNGRFRASVKRQQVKLRRQFSGVDHCFLQPGDPGLMNNANEIHNGWAMVSFVLRMPRLWSFFGFAPSFGNKLVQAEACPLLVLHE